MTAPAPLIGPDGIQYVPKATETTPDALCWIWAAIPPRADGRIDIPRVAAAVDRSQSTIRRWIRAAPTKSLDERALRILRMRANLRGHGDYLWPPLNHEAAEAAEKLRQRAQWRLEVLNAGQVPSTWAERELRPQSIYLYHHPIARVFGVATASGRTNWQALRKAGATDPPVATIEVPTRIHAQVIKYDILELLADHRCLPPRAMIPSGRTQTWWQRAGDVDLQTIANHRI